MDKLQEDLECLLIKQEFLEGANEIKEGRSYDYCEGFDKGVAWLAEFYKSILEGIKNDR